MKFTTDFNSLDAFTQARMRKLYHWTSALSALRILESRHIWSTDTLGFAHFSLDKSQPLVDSATQVPEMSLTFDFIGEVVLVPLNFNPRHYDKNVLYHHMRGDPQVDNPDGLPVAASRLAAGTHSGLKCSASIATPAFAERCVNDVMTYALKHRIEAELLTKRAIRVPKNADERFRLERLFLSPRRGPASASA